ncbi:peptidylprolyl isomerase [Pseudosulfitobacter koreensis]|uniref:Parvulin-like PPIase n=1 Tax=Pseudosulfitobacter koreensis TaxID=2968472 RepID=A0ABT1Z0R5_9RHOB|nr:peptidylprolyl isomerase [Pseudosulfitobacter koreense]MCR8826730.1 peptidylprolyl isomerase [Pseudosulfitobacter koreense]
MKRFGLTLAVTLTAALPLAAQNLFAPVARVDDSVITEFEVQQRVRFLQVLNASGATRQSAIDALIDDRLRLAETLDVGLVLTPEGLANGLAEFAGRANLSTEEFVEGLESAGVAGETFRDFVRVNLAWRELIRGRYANRVEVSEADIDRALAATGNAGGIRVLISEIIIPAPPNQQASAMARAEQAASSTTEAEFSSYARQFSATASRDNGGRLNWVDLNTLPESLRGVLLGLTPGEVTDPLPIPNAVALFQLRGIEETDAPSPDYAAVEYAAYYMAGGRSADTLARAQQLKAEVDVCDDLYGVAQGQPEEVLDRTSAAPSELPQDIAFELAKLDPGEVSTALTRADGQTLMFLMLCGRTAALNEDVNREDIALQLRQQILTGYSDSLLEELRADARIIRE